MRFIKKSMDWFRKFKFVDAMFFELYLFTVAIVIAKLLPVVLTLNVWIYAIVLAIWLSIIVPSIFRKIPKGKWFMDNYRKLSMWKIWVYKVSVMTAGLLVVKLIPLMLVLNIAWYVWIAFFAMWYVIAMVYRK